MKKFCVYLALALSLGGCLNSKNGIPLLGLSDNGKPVEIFISKNKFQKEFSSLLESSEETTLLALENSENKNEWYLRTAVLGLGVKVEAGIGNFFKVSATPRIKMAFSNSQKPIVP